MMMEDGDDVNDEEDVEDEEDDDDEDHFLLLHAFDMEGNGDLPLC